MKQTLDRPPDRPNPRPLSRFSVRCSALGVRADALGRAFSSASGWA